MGTAEDAIRRRKEGEERARVARNIADQQRARAVLDHFPPLASAIIQELDRLEWVDGHLMTPGGGDEIAFYAGGSGEWGVGSDGCTYTYRDDRCGGAGFWGVLRAEDNYAADKLTEILSRMQVTLTELQARSA